MSAPKTALAALIAVVVAVLPACSRSGDDGYRMTAYFEKGISLYTGGDVRVLGLPAGEIVEVEAEAARVRVIMRVRGDVPVPADVKATIVPLSLIGERYVQLFPAWTTGATRAKDGAVIPLDRTTVPVEPDEALAALKEFLDTLDPNATGRLVRNLAADLEGNGQAISGALRGISDLTVQLAEKDDELASIVDNFDEFTATLVTRERQLGQVMEGFATTAEVLAAERRNIERLVDGLARVSVDGLDLVSEHRFRLQHDLDVLARTLDSVRANIGTVRDLLSAGPILVAGEDLDGKNEGLNASYDPQFHRIDLRNSLSPAVSDLLRVLGIGSGTVCIPADVECPPGSSPLPTVPAPVPPLFGASASVASGAPAAGASAGDAPSSTTDPVDAIVSFLGSPTSEKSTTAAELAAASALTDRDRERAWDAPAPVRWIASAGRFLAGVLA
ncbi:MAG TPA: MCE family protein [Acidimicrobiales bacterium]